MLQWYKCFVAFEYPHYEEMDNKCHKFGSSQASQRCTQNYHLLPKERFAVKFNVRLRFRLEFNTSLRRQTHSVNLATNFQINTLSSPMYLCELWEIRPSFPGAHTSSSVHSHRTRICLTAHTKTVMFFFFLQKRNSVPKPKASGQFKAPGDSISSSLHVNGLVLMRGREAKLSATASRTI